MARAGRSAAVEGDVNAVGFRGPGPADDSRPGGAGHRNCVDAGPEPILVLENVSKTFDDGARTVALSSISLTVACGEFLSVLGPSGAGKSTLLRLIGDLLPPTAGTLKVCGHDPAAARRATEYGIVFQSPVLFPWRTVQANVELPLQIAGLTEAERAERSRATLDLVGLTEAARLYPRQLSGGMQQRVAIARALVARPRVLLMDEPFASLDELTRERLEIELLRIWEETGVTVVFVTHSIEEAVFLADRVIVLTPRPARIAAEVPVDLARPRSDATRVDPAYHEVVRQARSEMRSVA